MTLNDIQRAQLAVYAARAAGQDGALEQMKAIAICLRNRVRQGWHDGDWLKVIDHADDVAGNAPGPRVFLDSENRSFQVMIRDIDEIYFNRRDWAKAPSHAAMPSLDEAIGKCCYWVFLDRPITKWFTERVIKHPDHKQGGTMGTMMFYE